LGPLDPWGRQSPWPAKPQTVSDFVILLGHTVQSKNSSCLPSPHISSKWKVLGCMLGSAPAGPLYGCDHRRPLLGCGKSTCPWKARLLFTWCLKLGGFCGLEGDQMRMVGAGVAWRGFLMAALGFTLAVGGGVGAASPPLAGHEPSLA
jgi:hypothetical protein